MVFFKKRLPIFLIFYSGTILISPFFPCGSSNRNFVSSRRSFAISSSFHILNFANSFTEIQFLNSYYVDFLWPSLCVLFIFCCIHENFFVYRSSLLKATSLFIPLICNILLSVLGRCILYTFIIHQFLIPT
jgi:hypothetical protein